MGKLVGYAPRTWTDRKTGEFKERTVLWLSKSVDHLEGEAFDEVMIRKDQTPSDLALGDELFIDRDDRGFIKGVFTINHAKPKA